MAPIKLEPTIESLRPVVVARPLREVVVGIIDGIELGETDGRSLGEKEGLVLGPTEGLKEGLALGA